MIQHKLSTNIQKKLNQVNALSFAKIGFIARLLNRTFHSCSNNQHWIS